MRHAARGAALPALVLALALAGPALGHGSSIILEKDEGAYHIVYFGLEYVTEDETFRIGWNVTSRATGERVAYEDPTAEVRHYDLQGTAFRNETVPLEQPRPGLLFGDVQASKRGRMEFVLPLPEGSVVFEQVVCAWSDVGQLLCAAQDKPAPLPWGLAPLALGLAALVGAGARRRR